MVIFNLDQNLIRFTPEGKIAVIDAICALSDTQDADALWGSLLDDHPGLLQSCETYQFKAAAPTPVADREGWAEIEAVLFDYLVNESLMAAG